MRSLGTVRWIRIALFLVLVLAATWVGAQAAQVDSSTHYVAVGGDCGGMTPCYPDLQSAVDDAASGDTILVAGGIYIIPPDSPQLVSIDKNLTILGGFTSTNWETSDPLANPVTLDALNAGRVMVVDGPAVIQVDGVRLVHGNALGLAGHPDSSDAGGGLYVLGADVKLSRCWVTDSLVATGYGGGIYARGNLNTLSLRDCAVQSNQAINGSGLYLDGISATFTNNTIQLNAGVDNGRGGGILMVDSQVSLTGNLVKGNTHGSGAGVAIVDSSAHLFQNTLNENDASSNGGGIYSTGSTVVLDRNLISENTAANGAGVDASQGSTITMTHNTLSANVINHLSEGGFGGGANLQATGGGHIFVLENVLINNSAISGGGLYLDGDQPVEVNFNQLRENAASHQGAGVVVAGSQVSLNGNIIQDNEGTYCAGAGIAIFTDAYLTNNIVAGNVCPQYNFDAGIYIEGASPRLYHTTIANNGSQLHAGVYVVNGAAGQHSLPEFFNTIISDQTYGVYVEPSSPGSHTVVDHVLWWNDDVNTIGDVTVINPIIGDPMFVNATSDYHIGPTSAAIRQGFDAGVLRDIDYQPRHSPPDLGADEYWAPGELKQVYLPGVLR